MPELPEVETIRRHLSPLLEGRTVRSLEVRHPRMLRYQPEGRLPTVPGRRVLEVGRRGKYLLITLDGGLTWVTHLGMSGRVRLTNPEEPFAAHTHVVASFDGGIQLRVIDPRTFGFVQFLDEDQMAKSSVGRLGPDALEDGAASIGPRLEGRRAAIKSLLLDQRFIAGIGNIYADEILYRARIRPKRPGGSLSAADAKRLQSSVRPVLRDGLRWGGTSLDDLAYRLPDGSAGDFLQKLRVYGRESEPCRRCQTPIRRTVISARSSFWCPTCQK
ncbi:MAG: bifunctional DNA-formamidopyrimidine glycosylase/DNA-(apurinic or apyrimidinic site) lyase [Acidimicrobiia bacterium]